MNINGKNFTLVDLSRGKIKESYINEKFDSNILDVSSISFFDFSENQLPYQPEKNLYIDNKNYPIYHQYKNIYNSGYIYSALPYPYDIVFRDGEYHIEIVIPKIYEDLSPPKISVPNPYMERKARMSKAKRTPKRTAKPAISKLAR